MIEILSVGIIVLLAILIYKIDTWNKVLIGGVDKITQYSVFPVFSIGEIEYSKKKLDEATSQSEAWEEKLNSLIKEGESHKSCDDKIKEIAKKYSEALAEQLKAASVLRFTIEGNFLVASGKKTIQEVMDERFSEYTMKNIGPDSERIYQNWLKDKI